MKTLILSVILLFSIGISIYLFLTCRKSKCEEENKNDTKDETKGIFYFDIDGTLTTSKDFESIVQKCLENKIAVGIITNSPRTVESICTGDSKGGDEPGSSTWMSNKLCKQFNENNNRMFNSTIIVAGSENKPEGWTQKNGPGYMKAFDMNYGRNKFYPHVPDNCVILFDDNPDYLSGVLKYNNINKTNFGVVCANSSCGGEILDINLVEQTIRELKC